MYKCYMKLKNFTAMIKYLLLCLLATSQGTNGRPAHSGPGDLASHILIVTPQAQVHLEPALKYDAVVPNTFLQHLSPLARYAAPHDETIIYVPSGSAVARSSASVVDQVRRQDAKQYEQISQQIEQIQGAIQQGSSAVGPQLSEAASAAASAASNAGSGLFPALFPPAAIGGSLKEEKLKADKIEYEAIPAVATTSLLSGSAEGRRYYALTPAVSHVIDFVHTPVFVGPLSAIRARSIQASDTERETEKLSDTAPTEDSLKTELPLIELKEKIETDALKEIPTIEAERLKEDRDRVEQRDQRPERREDKLEEKKLENKKFEEKQFEEKKLDEKKFEEKRIEEKKLDENKFESKNFEEKKFEEKKAEEKKLEEKKLDEKKYVEKKIEEKLFEEKQLQQQITPEQKPQLLQQQLQQDEQKLQIPLLDKQPIEKELEKPQPLPLQAIQERKEQPIQERKDESKAIQQEQQQKQLLVEAPQQQQDQQKEFQAQQQQKQLQTQEKLEKPIEEQKELKEKREEFKELKKEEQLQSGPDETLKETLKKESVKSAETELNKITSEPEKDQLQPILQTQQQQRAASGRVEGSEIAPVHHAYNHREEAQQQQKSVAGSPVDPLPSVPLFVPQQQQPSKAV